MGGGWRERLSHGVAHTNPHSAVRKVSSPIPDSALRLGHTREALHLYLTLIIHTDRHQRIWRAGPQEDNTKRMVEREGGKKGASRRTTKNRKLILGGDRWQGLR